jgi:hypothetical protein
MFAVERIAMCQLMMIRGWRLEAGMFITCLNRVLNDDETPIFGIHERLFPDSGIQVEQNRNSAMAEGFQRMATQSPMWSLVIRYQAQVERQYRRAVEEFQRLVRERPDDFPNEPISGPQPDDSEPETPTPGEPIHEPANTEPSTPGADTFPASPAANPTHPAALPESSTPSASHRRRLPCRPQAARSRPDRGISQIRPSPATRREKIRTALPRLARGQLSPAFRILSGFAIVKAPAPDELARIAESRSARPACDPPGHRDSLTSSCADVRSSGWRPRPRWGR